MPDYLEYRGGTHREDAHARGVHPHLANVVCAPTPLEHYMVSIELTHRHSMVK